MPGGNSLLRSEQNEIYIYALREQSTPIRKKRAFSEAGKLLLEARASSSTNWEA
jgi:hypothetical protein